MTGSYDIPLSIFEPLDELMRRRDSIESFTVHPGSSLAKDDAASDPYQVSHGVHRHLDTAIDNLWAVKLLVVDALMVPTYGAFTLFRASIENFASACWMLKPKAPSERVLRTLRFEAANLKALVQAERLLDRPSRTLEDRMDLIRAVAGRNGLSMKDVNNRTEWSKVVRALGIDEKTSNSAEFLWKACSAFAHGDRWSSLAILTTEELPTSDDKIAHLSVSVPIPSLISIIQLCLLFARHTFDVYDRMRGAASGPSGALGLFSS